MTDRLLIVGIPLSFHVGGVLLAAARSFGIETAMADIRRAIGNRLLQALSWRLWDRRLVRMGAFEKEVLATCQRVRPRQLLATGLVPLGRATLDAIGQLGIRRLNYLTDDPWNPAQRSKWFLQALPAYDTVFSPRKANLSDLTSVGCREVRYMPFAYNPAEHYPVLNDDPARQSALACDVLFVGGADADRIRLISPLIRAGFKVALHGGYWDRYTETRSSYRGHADTKLLRQVTAAAKVTLVLVRRNNRDGHVMRTFEAAACRACMVIEDTAEHRSFFGEEGECVLYFDSVARLIEQIGKLLSDENLRQRLAEAAYRRIVIDGSHTYADRLQSMLGSLPNGPLREEKT